MVKKLRIKFIALSMISLFSLLALIITGVNLLNYHIVMKNSDEILNVISRNDGVFPDIDEKFIPERKPRRMSPETPYESRFYSVIIDNEGNVVSSDTSRIKMIDSSSAEQYGKEVFDDGKERGFKDFYRYYAVKKGGETRITFLDCNRDFESLKTFTYISIIMALVGFAVVFIIITVLSERIVRPISESYNKQKRFITDAGHEIKTPLTVINANVDLLESETDDRECINDIRYQTKRLANLTNRLVYLAKMEEEDRELIKIDFPVSDIISETVRSFSAPAQAQGKSFKQNIQPMLSLNGDEESIRELVTIIIDNALKYSPADSEIDVRLLKQNRQLVFAVENPTELSISKEDISRVFDRFYRTDKSRNSETGGYGIGLSIAQAIVNAHSGRISAEVPSENSFRITVSLPI